MRDSESNADESPVNVEIPTVTSKRLETTRASSSYKVRGEFSDATGAGVLGRNTAASGTPIGVEGAVPNASNGYGLSTPHDARVEGRFETTGAHQLAVDGDRMLYLGSTSSGAMGNVLAGGNLVNSNAVGVTIGGGGFDDGTTDDRHVVYDNYGTIGGGRANEAGSDDTDPTTARFPTVGGGSNNTASGTGATVPGGVSNTADGNYSFATGRGAETNGHDGAVVFGDSSTSTVRAGSNDEFRSQMPVYAPSLHTTSARAAKSNVEHVDPKTVLDGVTSLDVHSWEFTDRDDGRHIGPMAEDFHDTFELGSAEDSIPTVDADGVAFAAIQGLAQELDGKNDRIRALETENEQLRDRLAALEDRVTDVEAGGPTEPTTEGD